MCKSCLSKIRFIERPVCSKCGMEMYGDKNRDVHCGACLQKPQPFVLARSLVRYGPVIQKLIHTLKYHSDTSTVTALIEVVSCCELSLFGNCDLIIPVPLHRKRLQTRGLNQAVIMARIFFPERSEVLDVDLLERTINTRAQTQLNGEERRKNLKGSFCVKPRKNVQNKTICLVDDVFTTGTTVSECSKVLLQQGAKEVRVLTLARVEVSRHSR